MSPERRRAAKRAQEPSNLLSDDQPVRLNRFLASAGIASRRAVEELITVGRVAINGSVVLRPGVQVVPGRDRVTLDGERVQVTIAPSYFLLYKPRGVLTTVSDPHGRASVLDLLKPRHRSARLFPVGRLDLQSEGLILLTNDGAMAHRLMHPSFHIPKRYCVWTKPPPVTAALAALARGIRIAPRITTRPAKVTAHGKSAFEIVLQEGRKRQIRLMCEALGLEVSRLVRVAFGPLAVGNLQAGQYRRLAPAEIVALRQAVGFGRPSPDQGRRTRRS